MPKTTAAMKPDKLNETVISFHNQMLFLRLVNSGEAYSDAQRNDYVKKAFDTAYAILAHAVTNRDANLFNRIYAETHELVKGPYVTPEMEKIQNEFYTKVSHWVAQIAA